MCAPNLPSVYPIPKLQIIMVSDISVIVPYYSWICVIYVDYGFWVFVPSTNVSVQVQRMQREARNTQLCHQAGVALSKSGGRGHTAKFLRALVDKVFLGSTRKFSQTSW